MPNRRSRSVLPVIALLAVTAIWGSTFVIVKNAIARMPTMDFLVWRFAIATAAMAALRPGALRRLGRTGWWHGVWLGLALGAGYVFQTFGLETTSATVSGFLTGLFVVFTPLCAALLLRHRVPLPAWIGVALAALGLGLIGLHGGQLTAGEWLLLGCALAFALQLIGLGEWAAQHDLAGLATVQLATTAVLCLIGSAGSTLAPPPDAGVWAAVLLTAVAATALAFFIQTWAQTILEPTRTAVVLTMEPVFAAITGVAVNGDRFTARIAAGALCVLAAMLVTELGRMRYSQ